jgi:hypothetical protein
MFYVQTLFPRFKVLLNFGRSRTTRSNVRTMMMTATTMMTVTTTMMVIITRPYTEVFSCYRLLLRIQGAGAC